MTSTHHMDIRFYVENPNWVKNHESELDLIKRYESHNYKRLRSPP